MSPCGAAGVVAGAGWSSHALSPMLNVPHTFLHPPCGKVCGAWGCVCVCGTVEGEVCVEGVWGRGACGACGGGVCGGR